MKKLIWPLAFALGLAGCASLQDIANILSGNTSQKITKTPIWLYMPDLEMKANDTVIKGAGTTLLESKNDIQVWSPVDADRVEVTTCARHDVCQIKGGQLACDLTKFEVNTDFFGNANKYLVYHFIPGRDEMDDSCSNMMIAVYDKNTLASWGYIFFEQNEADHFPALFTCNATDHYFSGVSVCSSQAGIIQEINFQIPVDDFEAESACNIKKISSKEFEFQPAVGWCRASFIQGKKFHDVVINAYSDVLIRDGKE